jgi:hypothetical protein
MPHTVFRLRSWPSAPQIRPAPPIFLIDALKQSRQPPPLLGWDVIRGLYAIGKDSGEELARISGDRETATVGPAAGRSFRTKSSAL